MNKFIKALLITTCVLLLGACYQEYSPAATKTCSLRLQVSAGGNRALSGQVDFGSETRSSFQLDFVEENGVSHPGSFYFNGPAVHFILVLEEGDVFATGMMESNLAACSGKGGGTLSGPLAGDLGDWRGEWAATPLPTPPVQPGTRRSPAFLLPSMLLCVYPAILVFALFLAVFLFRLFAPLQRARPRGPASALRKTGQVKKPEPGSEEPLPAEYLATYTAEDQLFDLSFQVERPSGYAGECGITVARGLEPGSGQATALEVWLFDPQGPQTISKVLASNYAFTREDLRHELEQIGETLLIRPGETVLLETKGIRASAKVLQVEYELDSPHLLSLFKKVVVEIRARAQAG